MNPAPTTSCSKTLTAISFVSSRSKTREVFCGHHPLGQPRMPTQLVAGRGTMELYLCFAPHGMLSGPVKSGLGKEIPRLHIEATGARPESIHVVFQELAVGCHFLGGKCD